MKLHISSRIRRALVLAAGVSILCELHGIAASGQGHPPAGIPESERDSHFLLIVNKQLIPIKSLQWGAGKTSANPGQPGSGLPATNEITIVKAAGQESTKFLKASLQDNVGTVALVVLNKSENETLRYYLANAFITSYTLNRGKPVTETFTIGYARVTAVAPRTPKNASNPSGVNADRPKLTAVWDPALRKARLSWTTPSGVAVKEYKILSCPGDKWRPSAVKELDTLEKVLFLYTTDANLRSPGSVALFKVIAVGNSGEKESLEVKVTRP